nr:PREDICTED: neoverrucotoxin subunit beta-like [Latimeria chalumnae]|eukprot:XP_014354316.1 PREDICTED: neoverrucotoxin subunit beta-like [Latimeria chalumnae]
MKPAIFKPMTYKKAKKQGVTLWDLNLLKKDLHKTSQRNTEFTVIASDSIEDKSSTLNVEASLKASFLCGLVAVEGSGKYLNDKTISKQQAMVTLQYRTTTAYEYPMSHLGCHNVTYPDVFDQGTATHVVTAIVYRAQAFFVFDCTVSSDENKQDIQGFMKGMINKILKIEVSGQGSVHIKEQDKLQTNNFSCKFHGDFALPSNPTTFENAIKIYTDLPKMIGENGEHSVPIRVWLYPLNLLDSKAAELVYSISIGLVDCSQAVLEEIDDFDRQYLANYLNSPNDGIQVPTSDKDNYSQQSIKPWLNSDTSQQMKWCAMLFLKFAETKKVEEKTKFIVAYAEDKVMLLGSPYLYENGSLLEKQFQFQLQPKPSSPLTDIKNT